MVVVVVVMVVVSAVTVYFGMHFCRRPTGGVAQI